MTALSVERCIEVTDTKKRTSTKYKITSTLFFLTVIWLVALLFAMSMMLSFDSVAFEDGTTSCQSTWTEDQINGFFVVKYVLVFVIPFVVIVVSSGKLLKFLIRWQRKMAEMKAITKISYQSCSEPKIKIEMPNQIGYYILK